MACFLVPTAEAVVTTVLNKTLADKVKDENKISFINRLGRLNGMLWGGSGLLAFEHLWHGEISPFFPFLTAASDPADTAEMLHEMATSGTAMAVLVTAVWALTVAAEKHLKAAKNETVEKAGATS